MLLGDVEGPANLAQAVVRGQAPHGGFGGPISNGIPTSSLDAEATLDGVPLRGASTSTTEGQCMPIHSELALLRAYIKVLQDLSYRCEAVTDRIEQEQQQAPIAADERQAQDVPF